MRTTYRGEPGLRLRTVIYDVYQFVGIVLKGGRKLLNGPKNGVTSLNKDAPFC